MVSATATDNPSESDCYFRLADENGCATRTGLGKPVNGSHIASTLSIV